MRLSRYHPVALGVSIWLGLWSSFVKADLLTVYEKQPSILRIPMQANTYIQFWGREPITELIRTDCESLTATWNTQGSLWSTGYVKFSPKPGLDPNKTYTCHYGLGTRRGKLAVLTLIVDSKIQRGLEVTLITLDQAKLLKQQTRNWALLDGYDSKLKSWWKGLWD